MAPTKTPPPVDDELIIPGIITPTLCDQCGQFDTAPKVHAGVMTYHHDCTSASLKASILGGGHSQHPLLTAKIFHACIVERIKNDDLRELITSQQMKDYGNAEMLKYDQFANDVLDFALNNGASGTFVVGTTTYTLPLRARFLSTVSVAGTPGTEWSTSGGYTAGGVALNGLLTAAASAKAKANTGAVTVTNAPAQTWADNDVQDSTGTPKKMIFKGTPSLAKTVNSGDTCTIPIGSLTSNET